MLERRAFLSGLISTVAAPAIVRAGSLMPVRTPIMLRERRFIDPVSLTEYIVHGLPESIKTRVFAFGQEVVFRELNGEIRRYRAIVRLARPY